MWATDAPTYLAYSVHCTDVADMDADGGPLESHDMVRRMYSPLQRLVQPHPPLTPSFVRHCYYTLGRASYALMLKSKMKWMTMMK